MAPKYEADFAICLKPEEADDISTLEKRYYYWNGWHRRHWPANVIRPGTRLYGFDPRPNMRTLCVLLEITRGGSFYYRRKSEFNKQVKKLTGWEPNTGHPQWAQIPSVSAKDHPCVGIALRWKVLKPVSISLPIRFPRIGWLWLTDEEKFRVMESDFSDIYTEGSRKLKKHIVIERNSRLRNDSKAYWRTRMGQKLHCLICKFDFEKKYGEYGRDFIEMHHLAPVSKPHKAKRYRVHHLVPVCSNCHRILHYKQLDPIPIARLKRIIKRS